MRMIIKLLIFCLVGILVILGILSAFVTPKPITYQTNYWDFYSQFSDIYIKEVVRSGDGVIVYLYPDGTVNFRFSDDGTIIKEVGTHFVECTRTEGGKYITITNTDIPFLPKINPSATWGTPIGNNNDFGVMKELFKTPREGACYTQVDLMVELANKEGVIARRINLWQYPTNGMLTAGGHTTMEVYDRETKQWIWMDPLYDVVEGRIGSKPITLLGLQMAMAAGENITLTMTDGKEIQFDQWEHTKIWGNYLNPSQIITYAIPET